MRFGLIYLKNENSILIVKLYIYDWTLIMNIDPNQLSLFHKPFFIYTYG